MELLRSWETFYVIVGSSGAALTGLQFVVIALIAESKRRATSREIEAFGTPTIIHFCTVLLVSAIMTAPWHSLSSVAYALGVCGTIGAIYCFIVVGRARRQSTYVPVFEDWLFHAALPVIAHAMLITTAVFLTNQPDKMLFLVGAAVLIFLFTGIHNSWDTVTFITISESAKETTKRTRGKRGKG
jgi:hypothetical protein